jgi:hypothetical protein
MRFKNAQKETQKVESSAGTVSSRRQKTKSLLFLRKDLMKTLVVVVEHFLLTTEVKRKR